MHSHSREENYQGGFSVTEIQQIFGDGEGEFQQIFGDDDDPPGKGCGKDKGKAKVAKPQGRMQIFV